MPPALEFLYVMGDQAVERRSSDHRFLIARGMPGVDSEFPQSLHRPRRKGQGDGLLLVALRVAFCSPLGIALLLRLEWILFL